MNTHMTIEHEVAELKNLLRMAENRLRQVEAEHAELKLKKGGGFLKQLKKILIAIGLVVVLTHGAKLVCRHQKKKKLSAQN